MRFAIVGCGFVADFYLQTLARHPGLILAGVMDRDSARAAAFARFHATTCYASLDDILRDASVSVVVNLTNPASHYEVSKACLDAGKHVYSEKPLAMQFPQAQELVELAERRGLHISSAPCSLLGETAQTLWKALREEVVGKVRLVYAEMDDGLVHRMPFRKWISQSGAPWPYRDEFQVGCTLEHAGYYLTWLPAFFGPARTVTAFASCQVPDKQGPGSAQPEAPDFSVACITFASGVVARLTCSIIAPPDHALQIFGDEGILSTRDCWDYRSPVRIQRRINIRRRTVHSPWRRTCRLVGPSQTGARSRCRGGHSMDFCRGIADLARGVAARRPPRLSPRYCLHVNELVLAIQNAVGGAAPKCLTTTFDAVEPMDWAQK